MAKAKREKKVYPEEKAISDKLESLKKEIGDKKPTEAQAERRKNLRASLGKLKFERIANKRVPNVLSKIEGVAALGGANYAHTKEQREAIVNALKDAVAKVDAALSGTVKADTGFVLPKTS